LRTMERMEKGTRSKSILFASIFEMSSMSSMIVKRLFARLCTGDCQLVTPKLI